MELSLVIKMAWDELIRIQDPRYSQPVWPNANLVAKQLNHLDEFLICYIIVGRGERAKNLFSNLFGHLQSMEHA